MDDIRALVSFCFAFYEYLGDQRPFVITFYADRCIELNAQQLHLLPQKHHGYQHAKSPVRSPAKLDRPQQASAVHLPPTHAYIHRDMQTCRHTQTRTDALLLEGSPNAVIPGFTDPIPGATYRWDGVNHSP